jgi:SAM dependent carboxyl methyltransferase
VRCSSTRYLRTVRSAAPRHQRNRARNRLWRSVFFGYTIVEPPLLSYFPTLFDLLNDDPDSYSREDPAVFPYAIGRSFYRGVLPAGHVDLGWSSYAAVWLSEIPRSIPDHFFIPCCSGAIRREFDRQAALDWKKFLALRAAELRPGGRLVVVLPSLDHDGSTAYAGLMNEANATLLELVGTGFITAEERDHMTLAACPRRERDLLAPFADNGSFEGLVVEQVNTSLGPDTAWTDYERDRDAAALARKRAQFFRVVFLPSLSQGLAPNRSAGERQAFADLLEDGVRRRLSRAPARLDHLVGMLALAKKDS